MKGTPSQEALRVFHFQSYLQIISHFVEINQDERGYRSRLAEAAGVQSSFLTKILSGAAQPTVEQGFGLSRFWNLHPLEEEYFLTLLQIERASEINYKSHLQTKLAELRRISAENFRWKDPSSDLENHERQALYYSSWLYGAIHFLLTIPKYQSVENLAVRLNMSLPQIRTILEDLKSADLAERVQNHWRAKTKNLHLSKTSPFASVYHSQWRQKAIEDLSAKDYENIHYTTLYTMSVSDHNQLKQMILDFIQKTRDVVISSPEEELYCFTCDFFKP